MVNNTGIKNTSINNFTNYSCALARKCSTIRSLSIAHQSSALLGKSHVDFQFLKQPRPSPTFGPLNVMAHQPGLHFLPFPLPIHLLCLNLNTISLGKTSYTRLGLLLYISNILRIFSTCSLCTYKLLIIFFKCLPSLLGHKSYVSIFSNTTSASRMY